MRAKLGEVHRRMKRYGVAAGLVLALAFVSAVSAADDTFPGRNGRIVFTSVRANGGLELWSVKPDGASFLRLTAHSAAMNAAVPPAWAPDGRSIAFDAGVLLVVNVQTGRVRRLPTPIFTEEGGRSCDCPAGLSWSPDGRRFVLSHGGRLWIARRDGSGRRWRVRQRSGSGWSR